MRTRVITRLPDEWRTHYRHRVTREERLYAITQETFETKTRKQIEVRDPEIASDPDWEWYRQASFRRAAYTDGSSVYHSLKLGDVCITNGLEPGVKQKLSGEIRVGVADGHSVILSPLEYTVELNGGNVTITPDHPGFILVNGNLTIIDPDAL